METTDWRNTVRGSGEDQGYAERFYNNVHGPSYGLRKLIDLVVGMALIALLTTGFVTGYFREALLAGLVMGVLALLIWIWVAIAKRRKQDRLYREAVDRKNGIDRRFGRLGAKRK
ncbi:MAG: hypothetical protein AAFO77_03200 [Pseudomonadota bacterium]